MLYYFLDGLDKKGPYSADELRIREIKPETMVFSEGMNNWTAVKDLPDLYTQIFDSTNQEENADASSNATIPKVDIIENAPVDVKSPEKIKKVTIPAILFLILGIIAAFSFSYIYVKSQRNKDLELMNKKIEEVFQGKDEVCDHEKTGVRGELKKPDLFTPLDNEGKDLEEYYECTSGGFTVLTLSKKPNGYDLVESISKNLGYKIPASRWTSGKDYGYGIYTPGYSTPTFRQAVQVAYNGAMEYLTSEKENKSFVAGLYNRIKTFDELKTDYYYIDNIKPTKYSSATNSLKSWSGSSDAMVYNSQWVVWYSYTGKHYEVVENKKIFTKYYLIYSAIGSVLALLIYLLIRYRRRIALQVT